MHAAVFARAFPLTHAAGVIAAAADGYAGVPFYDGALIGHGFGAGKMRGGARDLTRLCGAES
jgi:hypothetical protein